MLVDVPVRALTINTAVCREATPAALLNTNLLGGKRNATCMAVRLAIASLHLFDRRAEWLVRRPMRALANGSAIVLGIAAAAA